MPVKTECVLPEVYLKLELITVWHTYHNDVFEQRSKNVFTTDPEHTDSRSMHKSIFSVASVREYEPPFIACPEGMEEADFIRTPAYIENKVAWANWWAVDETRRIRDAVIKMIVEGEIPRK